MSHNDNVLIANKRREKGLERNIFFTPDSELTEEEREIKHRQKCEASKKAMEAKVNKQKMRECLISILGAKVVNQEQRKKLKEMLGCDDEFIDNQLLLNFALFRQAMKGDVSAYKQIVDMIGIESDIPVNQSITINLVSAVPVSSKPATLDFEDEDDWEYE